MRRIGLAVALAIACGGCFDSDETPRADESAGVTTDVEPPGGTPPDLPEEPEPDDTGAGDVTCRDAIDCIVGCAAEFLNNPEPGADPILACLFMCDEGLNEEEALKLIELGNCVVDQCVEDGKCEDGSETDGGTETGGTETTDGEMYPCDNCISAGIQDPQPPGCIEEAAACD